MLGVDFASERLNNQLSLLAQVAAGEWEEQYLRQTASREVEQLASH